jgi:SAM-dependent methyltransferase
MNPEEYALMYQVEDHHWWYKGMEAISRQLLRSYYAAGSNLRILDAGCGTGAAAAGFLAEFGCVTGFDLAGEALHFCQHRKLVRLARASVDALPFADASFDLVASFDVLCERPIRDDRVALGEFRRVLAPGGRVLLRLPALNWLRGQHDQAVHIARRYMRRQVGERLRVAGFTVEFVGYANTFLLPIVLFKRWKDRLAQRFSPTPVPHSDLTLNAGWLNGYLQAILSSEAPWVLRNRLPVGVSIFAVGRKES